jgi:hypothetical protein
MRYRVINIVSGEMIFETNDLDEAKLGLTNTNRIIIDTDDSPEDFELDYLYYGDA